VRWWQQVSSGSATEPRHVLHVLHVCHSAAQDGSVGEGEFRQCRRGRLAQLRHAMGPWKVGTSPPSARETGMAMWSNGERTQVRSGKPACACVACVTLSLTLILTHWQTSTVPCPRQAAGHPGADLAHTLAHKHARTPAHTHARTPSRTHLGQASCLSVRARGHHDAPRFVHAAHVAHRLHVCVCVCVCERVCVCACVRACVYMSIYVCVYMWREGSAAITWVACLHVARRLPRAAMARHLLRWAHMLFW